MTMRRTRPQRIILLQIRSQRLRAKRRHTAASKVLATLAPEVLRQLKAENRMAGKKRA